MPLPPLLRSTWNPVSFEELRVQVSVTEDADVDVAASAVGAAGIVGAGVVEVVSGGVVVRVASELPPQAETQTIHRPNVAQLRERNRAGLERCIGSQGGGSVVAGRRA